jgi:hypothetical protein
MLNTSRTLLISGLVVGQVLLAPYLVAAQRVQEIRSTGITTADLLQRLDSVARPEGGSR